MVNVIVFSRTSDILKLTGLPDRNALWDAGFKFLRIELLKGANVWRKVSCRVVPFPAAFIPAFYLCLQDREQELAAGCILGIRCFEKVRQRPGCMLECKGLQQGNQPFYRDAIRIHAFEQFTVHAVTSLLPPATLSAKALP